MAKEVSFVEIVEEMVEEGHDLETIVGNLQAFGLSKSDSEKLVGIMEKKTVPRAQQAIDDLLRKKIISVEAAKQLKLERHVMSSKRRQESRWKESFRLGDKLIREFFPGKHLAFRQRWKKMAVAKQELAESRKEMLALFLEFDKRKLPYRAKHRLDKVIKLLK
jgi:hypothetical protein